MGPITFFCLFDFFTLWLSLPLARPAAARSCDDIYDEVTGEDERWKYQVYPENHVTNHRTVKLRRLQRSGHFVVSNCDVGKIIILKKRTLRKLKNATMTKVRFYKPQEASGSWQDSKLKALACTASIVRIDLNCSENTRVKPHETWYSISL